MSEAWRAIPLVLLVLYGIAAAAYLIYVLGCNPGESWPQRRTRRKR